MKKLFATLVLLFASHGVAQAAAGYPMDGIYWNPLAPSTFWLVIVNGAAPGAVPPGVATATSSVLIVMIGQSGTTQSWSYAVNTTAPVNTVAGTPMKLTTTSGSTSCTLTYNAAFDTVTGMSLTGTAASGTNTTCTALATSIGTPTLLKIF